MLRVNPKALANLNMNLLNPDGGSTQTTEVFSQMGAKRCFRDSDKNGDKAITKDEVTLSQAAFDKLDADKNGKVTQEEMNVAFSGHGTEVYDYYTTKRRAAKSADLLALIMKESTASSNANTTAVQKAAEKYIKNKDTNKDGVLDRGELKLSETTFLKLDVNKDNKVDTAEMKTALKGYGTTLSSYFDSKTTTESQRNRAVNTLLDYI